MIPSQSAPAATSPRLLSLDAFRGFDIILMFFVNLSAVDAAFPGWFEHAGWNDGRHGQWLADFVFPWFLFIVGLAIPFSMASGRGQGQSPARRIATAARRALIIYALGILIWMAKSSNDGVAWSSGAFVAKPGTPISWETLLHWDILPLIALGYFLAVVVYHTPRWAQFAFVFAIIIGKWLAMPDLTAQAGLVRADWVAQRSDIEAEARRLGFAGTAITQGLPAAATVVLGMLVGHRLRDAARLGGAVAQRTLPALVAFGVLLCAAAAVLHYLAGHRISKDFFTSSYVLISAGTGTIVLACFYAMLDVWRWPRWRVTLAGATAAAGLLAYTAIERSLGNVNDSAWHATLLMLGLLSFALAAWAAFDRFRDPVAPARCRFFVAYGSNAIAIYVLAELLWTLVWMHWRVQAPGDFGGQHMFSALQLHLAALVRPIVGDLAPGIGPWLATGVYIAIYGIFAWWLHRRKIYIKV